MKVLRIYGMAPCLGNTTPPNPGEEVWCSNNVRGYQIRYPRAISGNEWTHWFNLHSRKHMRETYPFGYKWLQQQDGTRPIYTQKFDPTIPGCVVFPGSELQEYFKTSDKPQRYFNCSAAWFLALAIFRGFERIEMWGFEIRATKPKYAFERPCFFYWVEEARKRGIEVWLPPEMDLSRDTTPGDPDAYDGPLYGYETKPDLED